MFNRIAFCLILCFFSTAGFSSDSGDRLLEAVSAGDTKTVRILIEDGADVNFLAEDGRTPLICAILRENTEMVMLLLENGADPDFHAPGMLSPVQTAQMRNLSEIADRLKSGEDFTRPSKSFSDLINIIKNNDTAEFLSAIAEHPELINQTSKEGATPLMYAAYWGKSVYVRTLLSRGADIAVKDTAGFTAIHLAAANGSAQTVKVLIQYKADINAVNADGMTPLMIAAAEGHENAVRLLIAAGADMKTVSKDGLSFFDYGKSGLAKR